MNKKTKIFFLLLFGLWIAAAAFLIHVNKIQIKYVPQNKLAAQAGESATSAVAGLFTSASAQTLAQATTTTEASTTPPANPQPQTQPPKENANTQTAQTKVPAPSSPSPAVLDQTPDPVTLRINSIKLVAPVIKTGLEADGSLHVPSLPDQTGWYELGPKPGDIGPAVITGHLDSAAGPGILYNLKNVKAGDEIDVVRDDGSTAVFAVAKLEHYPQDNFNTQAVYGSIPNAGLRIITCSGTYSRATKHYSDDLVVYANLTKIIQPGAYQPLK